MNKVFFALLFSLFLFPGRLLAAPSDSAPLSLGFKDVLKITDERNADILSSKESIEEALSRVSQAKSYFFPDISAEVSGNRKTINLDTFGVPVVPNAPTLVGPFNVFDARVRLTQTLFDASMVARFRAALAGSDVSRAAHEKIKEDVLALSGTMFVQVCRSQSRVDYAKENLRLAATQEKILKQRFKLGIAHEADVKKAQAELSWARAIWRSAVSEAEKNLLDLKTTLGFSPLQKLLIHDEEIPLGSFGAVSVKQSIEQHPQTVLLGAQRKEEKLLQAAENASLYPSVQASADYGANGRTVDGSQDTYFYGVKAVWDFFDFGRRASRVSEAHARVKKSETDFDQGLREEEAKIKEAHNALRDSQRVLRANMDEWIYEKSAYGSLKNKFENGSASRLDWIAASVSLTRAKDELEEARALYRIAGINLYHALGQMRNLAGRIGKTN